MQLYAERGQGNERRSSLDSAGGLVALEALRGRLMALGERGGLAAWVSLRSEPRRFEALLGLPCDADERLRLPDRLGL